MRPLLEMLGFSYTYPGSAEPALREISMGLSPGECACVTGPSGCGKTTLLCAVQGLLKQGRATGLVRVSGRAGWAQAGMVFQNAETQILFTTVEDEVTFGPANLDRSPAEISRRVRGALQAVGLEGFESRNVEHLSAGQKQRLTIASVLSMAPALLLLDEPTAQLDASGKQKLVGILTELKAAGHALLIADHDLEPFRFLSDRFIFMEKGRLDRVTQEPPEWPGSRSPSVFPAPAPSPGPSASQAVTVEDLRLAGPEGRPIFEGAQMRVHRASLVHLFGPNGSGKSSLLRCTTGFLRPDSGRVRIAGVDSPRPRQLLGKVGFLFQNPERQLFEDTARAEVAFSLRRLRLPEAVVQERVAEILSLCEASDLADRAPLTLSYGEQHRTALASVMAPRPQVLLLDEPLAGLDFRQRHRILEILANIRAHYQTAVVIASHDPLPDRHWADRTLLLGDGKIAIA